MLSIQTPTIRYEVVGSSAPNYLCPSAALGGCGFALDGRVGNEVSCPCQPTGRWCMFNIIPPSRTTKNTEKKLLFWICFNLPGYPKLPQNGSKCVQCSLFSSKFNVFLLFVVRVGSICSTSAADTRKGKGQWRNWWRSLTLLSPTSRSIWPMEILFQNKRHWDAQRFLVELLKLQVLK